MSAGARCRPLNSLAWRNGTGRAGLRRAGTARRSSTGQAQGLLNPGELGQRESRRAVPALQQQAQTTWAPRSLGRYCPAPRLDSLAWQDGTGRAGLRRAGTARRSSTGQAQGLLNPGELGQRESRRAVPALQQQAQTTWAPRSLGRYCPAPRPNSLAWRDGTGRARLRGAGTARRSSTGQAWRLPNRAQTARKPADSARPTTASSDHMGASLRRAGTARRFFAQRAELRRAGPGNEYHQCLNPFDGQRHQRWLTSGGSRYPPGGARTKKRRLAGAAFFCWPGSWFRPGSWPRSPSSPGSRTRPDTWRGRCGNRCSRHAPTRRW